VGQNWAVRIDVFTIFPNLITDFCSETLLGRAQKNELLTINAHDLRDGATDRHRTVDDTPFGGGAGMVLGPEPVFKTVEATDAPRPLYLLSPGGRKFDQAFAHELAETDGFSLLCGRYEGVDQRITDHLCDGEISIGDFVLAGGEVAALTIIEATTRLIPGVMGNDKSAEEESFARGMLEYPQYTRPACFRDWDVPEILQSGDHGKIREWREAAALLRTLQVRPEMIESFTEEQQKLLEKYFPERQ
jgi:tRNA (guanine37-N1)-methyltransferase